MTKVLLKERPYNRTINMKDMKVGQLGVIVLPEDSESEYKGHIVLATFSGVISLTDPMHTWNTGSTLDVNTFPIRILSAGSEVTLIQ